MYALLSIGQEMSGVSFQIADRIPRKLGAYVTKDAIVIVWPTLSGTRSHHQ